MRKALKRWRALLRLLGRPLGEQADQMRSEARERMAYAAPLCALVLAPLLLGVINRTKAFVAGRRGPPLLQPYRDV